MAAGLSFDLPAQLAGQVLEPVQGGIDADVRGVALDREALSNWTVRHLTRARRYQAGCGD
jgi:hypothetical protein